jgi:hypothetical protein
VTELGAPATAQPRYNRIYESLVTADDDLVGMIAYALYKQSKREWLLSFEADNGVRPNVNDIDAYVRAQTQFELRRLRSQAESILSAYAAVVVDAETPSIREDAIESHVLDQVRYTLNNVEKQGSFFRQLATGAIIALGYTIFLITVAIALKYAGIDLIGVIGNVGRPQ